MNTKMHGKSIDYIDLNPAWSQSGNPECIASVPGMKLTLSATYHGDHDEFWIVATRDGNEVARFNPSGVMRIQWSPASAGDVT